MAQLFFAYERLDGRSGHDVGRQLLARLYREHVRGALPEIQTAPMGKPYFAEGAWHFSISHSQNHAFCALCDCPVGIDAEELTRSVPPKLAENILSPGEKAQYDVADDKNRALLIFWVLKEAEAKLTGQGIKLHPTDTDFMLTDSRIREVDGCLVAIFTQEETNHAF